MNYILVDTSVLSLAFRKKQLSEFDQKVISLLTKYLSEFKIVLLGAIRQETLSGISNQSKYEYLRSVLRLIPDFELATEDYEIAAHCYNVCRSSGIQGSHTDFLICAVAMRNGFKIFTLDKDFWQYQKYINIELLDIGDRL